ncbi:hypothetical protein NSK_007994 [Nannochloropsis salina CCMP1776]|uniref:PNPLA domain-containing protein n=1 Tax=Nannochloropsis salina CCMP1776 TaxID=1027361 RepID=A0A4D9CRA8_9STRA|nr:hypothetical protein NSK_007994 [Nannochloropsis salina CCMP1776]|eukprot:TFJ80567.1 hypothetical protein NSK_007994 [Nannochloropsis salina CCMP1776]
MKGDEAPNSRIQGWHQQRRRRITMMGQVFVGLCLGAVGAETTYPPGTQELWALRRRSSEQEEADVDSENRRRKSVRVTSLEQLHQVLSPEGGLRLRDLDVRGDSTAALLSSSFPPSPSPSSPPSFHPVAAAIHARIASRSTPGARTDGLKIGLSLEGGGMRGCVGAGMLAALNHLGLRDTFDVVYGSSAGSLMGAYFLSGQIPLEGPGIYYDILSQAGRKFIDQRQIMRSIGLGALDFRRENYEALLRRQPGRPVLNLDFLLESVIENLMPLEWGTFWTRQEQIPLKVVVSALQSQQPVALSSADGNFQTLAELAQCMRASMLLPGIAGPLVRIEETRMGTSLVGREEGREGGREGEECTHVLVLRTRPDGVSVTGKMSLIEKLMYRRFFSRKNELPGIAQWMTQQQHKRIYAEDVLRLNQEARDPGSTGPTPLMTIALREDMPEIHRLEMRREVLLEGVRNGFAVAYDLLVPEEGKKGKGTEVAREVFRMAEQVAGEGNG